jgi:acetyl esterase/lipase
VNTLRWILVFGLLSSLVFAEDGPNYTRTEDVIYHRKFGVALTMDVIKPKDKLNGLGIIFCVSGGWFSNHDQVPESALACIPYLTRGYTIFTVVHGSQPKFTIPECIEDMRMAVRFIRMHAKEYGIDPDRIGVSGGSAGGHLSLMLGTTGDDGNPASKIPVERVSSRVQCVACFFPPTDFLNYGKPGESALGAGILKDFPAPFDFHVFDTKQNKYVAVTDVEKRKEFGRSISPIYHVSAKSAPTLIAHGDADKLVPIQQAQIMIDKLQIAGVDCKLVTRKGGEHGWDDILTHVEMCADWFDAHLKTAQK